MNATALAQDERAQLADLLTDLGPDAPTLCEGWLTRDLAAHLIVRESRPDAAVGILVPAFAGWTKRVTDQILQSPYDELVHRVRTGPPTLSVFSLPGADGAANLLEYFVHLEDVRRAQPEWNERSLSPQLTDTLWARMRGLSRMLLRSAPSPVALERSDTAERIDPGKRPAAVIMRGLPGELVLRLYGRRAAHVEIIGDPADVAAFESTAFGI